MLLQFQTIHDDITYFGGKILSSLLDGNQELRKHGKSTFLESLIEFVKAEFTVCSVPENIVEIGMNAMDQHSQD
jgi:hypothetical protein